MDSLGCSHTFCQNCLVLYFEPLQNCPSCHRIVDAYPVCNHALEHLFMLLSNNDEHREPYDWCENLKLTTYNRVLNWTLVFCTDNESFDQTTCLLNQWFVACDFLTSETNWLSNVVKLISLWFWYSTSWNTNCGKTILRLRLFAEDSAWMPQHWWPTGCNFSLSLERNWLQLCLSLTVTNRDAKNVHCTHKRVVFWSFSGHHVKAKVKKSRYPHS